MSQSYLKLLCRPEHRCRDRDLVVTYILRRDGSEHLQLDEWRDQSVVRTVQLPLDFILDTFPDLARLVGHVRFTLEKP